MYAPFPGTTMGGKDWMLPEAWSVEHNNLHHWRLSDQAHVGIEDYLDLKSTQKPNPKPQTLANPRRVSKGQTSTYFRGSGACLPPLSSKKILGSVLQGGSLSNYIGLGFGALNPKP